MSIAEAWYVLDLKASRLLSYLMLKFSSPSLLPPDISVSLLLKVEESVQQSYSFYNGYNGSYDKPPLIPQVYAY